MAEHKIVDKVAVVTVAGAENPTPSIQAQLDTLREQNCEIVGITSYARGNSNVFTIHYRQWIILTF